MKLIKNNYCCVIKYFKNLITRIWNKRLDIRLIYIFAFIITILLAEHINRIFYKMSLYLVSLFPLAFHDNKVFQFFILFAPIIFISTLVHLIIPKIGIRISNYYFLLIHIYFETFIDTSEINFSNYFYFYLTIDTFIYLLLDKRGNMKLKFFKKEKIAKIETVISVSQIIQQRILTELSEITSKLKENWIRIDHNEMVKIEADILILKDLIDKSIIEEPGPSSREMVDQEVSDFQKELEKRTGKK